MDDTFGVGHISRRDALRRGAQAAALLGFGPLLAGCGSDGGSAKTTSTASGAASDAGIVGEIFGGSGKASGKGLTIPVGAVLALTGGGAAIAKEMQNGINLAVEQIAAAGGPRMKVAYKDHATGNAQLGAAAARQLGGDGVKFCLTTFSAVLGSMLPGVARAEMLTLDGGGGATPSTQGKPYFYGARIVNPNDSFPGLFKFVKDKVPDASKVAMINGDFGKDILQFVLGDFKKALAGSGLTFAGNETVPLNTTDFSSSISRINGLGADVLYVYLSGDDPAFFMKQYVGQQKVKQAILQEWVAAEAKTAGAAYGKAWMSFDYFDATKPNNDWSRHFVESYKAKYKVDPDIFAANYYEDMFVFWKLVQRVLKTGGKVTDGKAILRAFTAEPSFPSLYGGGGKTPGVLSFNLKNHSVARRPMGVWNNLQSGATPKQIASFDIGGKDYKAL